MLQVQTKITGDKEIMRKIQILSEKCDDKLGDIIRDATIKTEAEAKKNCPAVFSHLRNSLTHELINRLKEHIGKVGTSVKYAPHVEFGTRPHLAPISAEYARKYGIPVPAGKDYVMVKVSGKAQPYLFPALKTGNKLLLKKLSTEIKEIKS